jgi:beta-galactosidase
MSKTYQFICLLLFCTATSAVAQQRKVILLDTGWKFSRTDEKDAASPAFNDNSWQNVTVPHDWAISGPFDMHNDAQTVMVTEDGERKPALRTGRTGSLPWVGVGWYRKNISIPASAKGSRCFVEFDGAMSHAVVYLNGERIGTWPYGYASFSFELTKGVHFGKENILAVRLENLEEASRWYPGAGLYRNVRLVYTNPVHINHWGTYITTPEITDHQAGINIKTEVLNQDGKDQKVQLITEVIDPSGKQVAVNTSDLSVKSQTEAEQKLEVTNPQLWSTETPVLYKAISTLKVNSQTVDVYETSFGIRSIAFDNNRGFILNGKQVKIKGVCNHQDLGPLGSAVNYRAIERQLTLLKEMGCNAIRTSHNPPDPQLLDLCDKMGFLVMDEAFDEWKIQKCKNGYHLLFDDWAEKDLTAMIRRDRNHPSVILWSIGNEVPEQKSETGAQTAKFLVDIAHREDPTRLTTSAFNSIPNAVKNGLAAVVDVVGFNYWPANFAKIHAEHPEWKLLGSETESALSSRGEYMFPVVEQRNHKYPNKQISSYDLDAPSWGNAPDVEFAIQDAEPYVAGQFVWTGFDYLGEPTPYNNDYPSHSSYFGILDLAGIPKDRYYLYQSNWTDKNVLHLLPHWNWPGREGQITPVHCYTSYTTAELFVNGKSQGIRKKNPSEKYGSYRLTWDNVLYEPGELKVVALDADGKPAATEVIKTAGQPYQIKLTPDNDKLTASGKDLSYLLVSVLDKDGNVCPTADDNIRFQITGAGSIKGVCNGDATNTQILTGSEMKLFNGRCVVVVQSSQVKGNISVSALGDGLKAATTILTSK